MNFYKEAAQILDRLDKKQGSIKSCLSSVNDKDRKRTAALVIETLKCKVKISILPPTDALNLAFDMNSA